MFSRQSYPDDSSEDHPIEPEADIAEEGERPTFADEESDVEVARPNVPGNPLIVPRTDHSISRRDIDPDALKVMYRLVRSGFQVFLVGGGVRDLLLGKRPKDFDISTDARPEVVRRLFRNSRIIGRRFRMNHVYFRGGKIIEVSTFRASSEEAPEEAGGEATLPSDNTFGNAETDAVRRDLTINGLFYDPATYCVIDYVGGLQDLRDGVVRIIGTPAIRFKQDPVRMIRAVRHAARTGFRIDDDTRSAICELADLISTAPKARVYDEFMRELRGGAAQKSIVLLFETGLLRSLMPELHVLMERGDETERALLNTTLQRIDARFSRGRELPACVLLLAVLIEQFAGFDGVSGENARSELRNKIGALFTPVGATKRDREEAEDVIVLAHQLFRGVDAPPEKKAKLRARPLFQLALLLLEFTVCNPEGKRAFDVWRAQLNVGRPRHGGDPRRRRR